MQVDAKPEPVDTTAATAPPDVSPEAIAALVAQGAAVMAVSEMDLEGSAAQADLQSSTSSAALELLIGVTHDMRSPLSSMMVLVERLRTGQAGPVTAAQERQLGLLYSAVFGLAGLTNDALDCARGTQQLTGAAPVTLSILDIFASVRGLVQPIAEERGLLMRWSSAVRDRRVGHAAALHRVLVNLVTNALKNTTRGTVSITAEMTAADRVLFTVTDSGRGVPEQILARFARHEPSILSNQFSSSGLGLGLCDTLVREMGGSFEIHSEPNKGTRCSFVVPLPLAR